MLCGRATLQYTVRTHWPAGFSGRVLSREMRCGGSPGGWNAAALAASGPLMIAASGPAPHKGSELQLTCNSK